jgi:L-ascorbate metabolism protein UlaG (beta-lactamase superfamily)
MKRILLGCLCIVMIGVVTIHAVTITLVAGSGYVFRDDNVTVAIDALTSYGTTVEMQEKMRAGEPPYDLDIILVTHSDFDHFDAAVVAANMQTQTGSLLVGLEDVIGQVRARLPGMLEARLISVDPEPEGSIVITDAGLPLSAFSLPHPPNGSRPNLGFMLTIGSITLFHPGDLDSSMATELFEAHGLASRNIDIAFLPSFMFMDTGLVEPITRLGASCLVPTHLLPRNLASACQIAAMFHSNVLCFRSLNEELEYTADTVCNPTH